MEHKDMNNWKDNSEFNGTLINDSMITSSIKKAKHDHRVKVIQCFSIILLAPLLTFTLLVNTNQQFVSAINDMPIISELIDMFKYNPSIYRARNTDGFQKIDKTYEADKYSVYIESMVVDEDQIAIYYQVNTSLNDEKYNADLLIQEYEMYNAYPAGGWKFNELTAYVFDPLEEINLETFTLEFKIETSTYPSEQVGETLVIEIKNDLDKIVSGKITELNKEIIIDEQKITIQKIEVYPLRSIVYIHQDPNNTKEIRSYHLYMKSRNGELIEGISNGISGMKIDEYTNAIILESPYTSDDEFDIYLDQVRWVDKDDKEIIYNKETKQCTNLPSYLELTHADDIELVFTVTGKYPTAFGDFGKYIHFTDESILGDDGIVSFELVFDIDELEFDENNETVLIDDLGYMKDVDERITTIHSK